MKLSVVLKPNIKSIILALILIIIFVPFINYDNGTRCIRAPCPADSTGSILFYSLENSPPVYKILYINLIIGILASYIVSCALISLIKRN